MSPLRRWSALAVLALPVLLISIDMTVLGFAVPALTTDLGPTSTELLWIVDIYSFLLAGLLVLMGNLGDRIGRRRLLVAGAAAFGGASLVAAFSTTAEVLIAARALLGLGGATLMPSTLALLRSVFPDARERRLAIAVWAAAFSGGAALGPIIGGFLLEQFWWGSVFLVNAPVMVLLLVGAPLLLPESRPRPGPFDALSAVLSIAGVLPLVYALKTAAHDGVSVPVLVGLAAGLGLLWTFVRRQRRLAEPLLDLRLFGSRAFSVAVTTNLLTVFALLGLMFFLPQYLMLVLGMSPLVAGLWMLPLAGATVAGSLAAPWLARALPLRWVIGGGMALAATGLAAGTMLGVDGDRVVLVVVGLLIGTGVGAAEALTNDVILATAPPERAGAAASVSETAYEFGGAMGTAVLGTVGMSVYAAHLGAVDGVPARDAEAARETLGGAAEVAAGLPADTAAAFLAEAGEAFVTGMHVVLGIAAVLAAYVAVQAVVLLRGSRGAGVAPADRPAPETETETEMAAR